MMLKFKNAQIAKLSFLSVFLLILNCSCDKSGNKNQIDNEYKPIVVSEKSAQIVSSSNQFGLDLLMKLKKNSQPPANIFISPLSVFQALSMAANGAEGETLEQILAVLKNGSSLEALNEANKSLREALLSSDAKVKMTIANSMWVNQSFSLNPNFADVNKVNYDAKVQSLDFSQSEMAKNTVNTWVSDHTNGKIPSIVDNVTSDHALFLINAVYFKGQWMSKFDSKKTVLGPFTNSDKTSTQVAMMQQKTTVGYAQMNDYNAIDMPYGNGHFSMMVLLPNEGKSTTDVLNAMKLESESTLSHTLIPVEVNIKFPQLKVELDFELNDALAVLGMPKAFSNMAEFGKILSPVKPIAISKVKHKTFLEVNEDGTEAAAATSVEFYTTSMLPDNEIYFTVNKPFVLAIREKDTHCILFLGAIEKL